MSDGEAAPRGEAACERRRGRWSMSVVALHCMSLFTPFFDTAVNVLIATRRGHLEPEEMPLGTEGEAVDVREEIEKKQKIL